MHTRANNVRNPQVRAVANHSADSNRIDDSALLFIDNRPESMQLKRLQWMAENSPQAATAATFQAMADGSGLVVAQRVLLDGPASEPAQRQGAVEEEELQMKAGPGVLQKQGMEDEELQMKAGPGVLQKQDMEEEELQMNAGPGVLQKQGMEDEELQMKAGPGVLQKQGMEEEEPLQGRFLPVQKKDNNTGMPDQLKAGVEHLSGMPLDDVKVHYNSAKPATLQALAYTQGTDIHVGPGQQKHLPHEAWHVAQQKQGRVRPTMQMAGTQINDDARLENEAEVMGAKASRTENEPSGPQSTVKADLNSPRQFYWIQEPKKRDFIWDKVIAGFRWYYNSESRKLYFLIEQARGLSPEDYLRLKKYEKIEYDGLQWNKAGWLTIAIPEEEILDPVRSIAKEILFPGQDRIEMLKQMGVIPNDTPEEKGIAAEYWGEALDKLHRPIEELKILWDLWKKELDPPNFYDWLEKSGLKPNEQVVYMDQKMRQRFLLHISGLKVTSGLIRVGPNAFAMDSSGNIYSTQKRTNGPERIHHSSFMAGLSVAAAGSIGFKGVSGDDESGYQGEINYVNDYSGHYQPGIAEMVRVCRNLIKRGAGEAPLWIQNTKNQEKLLEQHQPKAKWDPAKMTLNEFLHFYG